MNKPSKQELVAQYRSEAILAATRRVIERDGADFTLERVAEEAGVAKGTIYLYFPSKEELVFSMIKESVGVLIEQNRQLLDADAPFADRLFEMVRSQLQFVDANRKIFLYYRMKRGGSDHGTRKDLQHRMQEEFTAYLKLLEKHFKRAVKDGEVRRLKPHRMALVLHGISDAMMMNRVLFDATGTIDEDARFILDILLRGIGPESGGKP